MKFEVKDGKLEIRTGVKEDDEDLELTGAFVPDALLAVTTLPDSKGKSYRFTCLYQGKVAPFTIDDMGKEKVRGRSGEVEARKLVLKDQDGEVDYWVDDKHAVLVMKTVKLENLVAFAGTREESLADWTTRSDDEADVAADKLMTGPAGLAGLTGELRFGAYMENGGHEVYNLKLKSEEKDGKPAFHFTSVAAIDSSKITDDWWFSAEGAPLGGTCKHAGGETEETITGRIDGKNIATKSSESKEKDKEKVFPLPRRFSPDAIFLLRALRGEEKGTFRFGGFDLSNEIPLSVYFRIAGTEALKTAKGEVKAKHVHLEQNAAEAECWIDEAGSPLLVRWGDGDIYAAGPIVDPKDLPRPASEPEKKKDEDE
ncbi:hypothetical protein HY251_14370 [bacterium]|nr:hypothetical protein [bacterium]